MDWNGGEYERTAVLLEPVSTVAIEAAKIGKGDRVLDLGAGTGNAAMSAARRGASVVAVEPAPRLVELCRERAEREGLAIDVKQGEAGSIPLDDGSVDVILSVFAVIFAPDAERATAEMFRVVRPNGRVVVTSWLPTGPISRSGAIVRDAMSVLDPNAKKRVGPAWGDPAFVDALFARHGFAATQIEERTIVFEAESPEAWLDEQERYHPIWRGIRAALAGHPGVWERAHEQSLAALREGNEDPKRFKTTSRYLLIVGTKGA